MAKLSNWIVRSTSRISAYCARRNAILRCFAFAFVADFDRLRYVNCEPFLGLTDDARSVNIGARNYKRVAEFATRVDSIARNIGAGLSTSELILVEDRDRLVVLEGNTRATAHVQTSTLFSALVGSSPTMREWAFI
jgi:hypothetical protein